MKTKKKRPVGRPRTDKAKIIISIDPEIRDAIDNLAKQAGLTRSAYVENLIRKFLR